MVFKFYCKVVVITLFSWATITILESRFKIILGHIAVTLDGCVMPKLDLISVTLKYIRYSTQTLA